MNETRNITKQNTIHRLKNTSTAAPSLGDMNDGNIIIENILNEI